MATKTQQRAAVVGSGFGGLAVAIRMQAAGIQTTVFEARDKPGGRAYVYEEGDFRFDGGPTVITAPHCLEELFELSGSKLSDAIDLLPVTPFYRLRWADGSSFDYGGSSEAMRAGIRSLSPGDVAGYDRFVAYSKRVFQAGYVDLVDKPFLRFADMVRVAPQLASLRADRSVYSAVARHVKDERVRQALSFHSLLVGGNPFETSAIYTLIHYLERKWGVYFPRGGTGALIAALVRHFEKLGGTLCLNAPVDKIDVTHKRGRPKHIVRTQNGDTDEFDLVVSNADVHHTYSTLYRDAPSAQRTAKRIANMHWSMSLFVLYFGTNHDYGDQIAHHNVLFGPRYRELLDEVFSGFRLPDDFSLYLHAPCVTDPSMAPAGCNSFYVLSPVPHLGNAAVDWDEIAPVYADRILTYLESVLPDLRKNVVVKRWLTPFGFRDDLRSYHGSAFSCAPRLTQSAYFRPQNRDRHIENLFIVGAGTHPGAGIPGVVNSAKATAKVIFQQLGMAPNSGQTRDTPSLRRAMP